MASSRGKRFERDLVETVIDDIARALAKPPPPAHRGQPGTATGLMAREPGFALFYAYLDRLVPDQRWRRRANRFVERALDAVPKQKSPFLAAGSAGTAWAIQHLHGWFLDAGDINDDFDDAMLTIVEQGRRLSYDVQHGVAGVGLYACERLPNPKARRLLEAVVAWLEREAVALDGGLAWRTPPEWFMAPGAERIRGDIYQAGVFAGVAGVVGVLGAAIHHDIAVRSARTLLEGALAWLWSIRESGLFPAATQLAWSHGSLGIAAVMHVAARAAGLVVWEQRALEVAIQLATLRGPAARLPNATLGVGAAGTAHMFARLHRDTNEACFADAATRAFTSMLRRRRPGAGLAGFRVYISTWNRTFLRAPSYPVGWVGLPGLSNGVAGIGLVCLAWLGQEPAWDRLLLLSHKAR